MIKKNIKHTGNDCQIELELKRSSSALLQNKVISNISALDIYNKERVDCNQYRLILTINNFCSNVLFNPFTEIVKGEGSSEVYIIKDEDTRLKYLDKVNDEYSYNHGMDIFNNHLLRLNKFKINIKNKKKNDRSNDNTLSEQLKDDNGNILSGYRRTVNKRGVEISEIKEKHLYMTDDILSMEDGSAINENLIERDGWIGFINSSSMDVKNGFGNRILTSHPSCGFVDMYPDRTLYSFTPKYNSYKNRNEYNWDICLTYPYAMYTESSLFTFTCNNVNYSGIPVTQIIKKTNVSGGTSVYIRTMFKHKLKQHDTIKLFYYNTQWNELEEQLIVLNTGDNINNNQDFWFYVHNSEELNKILSDNNTKFFINRTNGDMLSDYYVRIFKKIPNYRDGKGSLTKDIVLSNEKFNNFIKDNCYDSDVNLMKNFQNEIYPLSFANTIYGDDITQFTFTDTINLEYLVDHRGRPLSEIYVTTIKSNRGHNEWYNNSNWDKTKEFYKFKENTDLIEYSHCFGKVTSGIDCGHEVKFLLDKATGLENCDVHILNNLGCYPCNKTFEDLLLNKTGEDITIHGFSGTTSRDENNLNKYTPNSNSNDTDLFWGDIVEYNAYDAEEKVLSPVLHRFNTHQREMEVESQLNEESELNKKGFFGDFAFTEITGDDYDFGGFKVESKSLSETKYSLGGKDDIKCWNKPEGYFYTPHHKITIKTFSEVKQDSHRDIIIDNASILYGLEVRNKKVETWDFNKLYQKDNYVIINGVFYKITDDFIIDKVEKLEVLYDGYDYLDEADLKIRYSNDNVFYKGKASEDEDTGDIIMNYYKCTIDNETDVPLITYTSIENSIREDNGNSIIEANTYFVINDELYRTTKTISLKVEEDTGLVKALTNKYIKLVCSLKHQCNNGSDILLYDTTNNKWLKSNVVSIINSFTLVISTEFIEKNEKLEDYIKKINSNEYKIKRRNYDIPTYAQSIKDGQMLWRDVLNNNSENEKEQYIFTNGHLYVNKNINFYLQRQDPFGKYQLFTGNIQEAFPQDMKGADVNYANQEYKDETYVTC